MKNVSNRKVSFENEMLILVDENDEIIGHKDKLSCHAGDGILHRAFSIFIFNSQNQLLMQKRSAQKQLWPLYWSNSCCSHPRQGEWIERSTLRRLREELGFSTDLKFLYKFQYQANFDEIGAENELCSVFIGKYDGEVVVNENEIAEWEYWDISRLEKELAENPEKFTPWFKMEWERLRNEFKDVIDSWLNS
ncbi:MAG: isopentenyl-diphosphate Delta-isomerase [Calditrichia bacterium]